MVTAISMLLGIMSLRGFVRCQFERFTLIILRNREDCRRPGNTKLTDSESVRTQGMGRRNG